MPTTCPATASTSCPSASRPTFPSLPREIRLHILRQTHLLRNFDWAWQSHASGAGPTILDGKLRVPPHNGSNKCSNCVPDRRIWFCYACQAAYLIPFPLALFTVNKQMYDDAQEVFWSQRFVLKGDFEKSKDWLESLGDSQVRRIRKLDLVVKIDQIATMGNRWWGPGKSLGELEKNWTELIRVISQRVCLEKLHLSLDAGIDSEHIWTLVKDDYDTDTEDPRYWLKRVYKKIFVPVVREFKGHLKTFHVFLCWSVENKAEEVAEMMVLGQEYGNSSEGKVEYLARDKRNPHWRVLEGDENENRRQSSGSETVRMFDMRGNRDLKWLESL